MIVKDVCLDLILSEIGHRAVFVGHRIAFFYSKDEENNRADDRNEVDEYPPSGFAYVVHTAHCKTEVW